MRSRVALLLALASAWPSAAQYREAAAGYRYEFPRDHFDHPEYQTEWWYYTGNVKTADGRRFGFELTFFRQGVSRDPAKQGVWDVRDVYLAHLALSDMDEKKFYYTERINRAGPGIAGASEKDSRLWNGNWSVRWRSENQELRATSEQFSLDLLLQPEKPPVINGINGVSQKAKGTGKASQYISLTRLDTSGTIKLQNNEWRVTGFAWMDHEFFTHQLEANQTGWDWLSLQFDDKTELMLFRIRRSDGTIDPYSAGTYVDAKGKSAHLSQSDFLMEAEARTWASPETDARYPIRWRIAVPKLRMEAIVTTRLPSQELVGKTALAPNYWEGAIDVTGEKGVATLQGVGYLEMTGYDRAVKLK